MRVDNTQPWVESKVKLPKFGKVLSAILEIEKSRTTNAENLNLLLTTVETNVRARLTEFDNGLKAAILTHVSKHGPAHGETKATIGLGKKENLPAAKLSDVLARNYKREFLTPETLQAVVEQGLKIDDTLYVRSGVFPLSYGVTLGRSIFNQRYSGVNTVLANASPAGVSQSLLSTEDGYLLFADHANGYDSNFSEGGDKAPIGTTLINIIRDNLSLSKGTPASLNDITASDDFVSTVTGLEWGFGDNRGNYYDSNFHPTVQSDAPALSTSTKQSIESTLFDPTLIYKPDGTYTFRNYNLTKHNFTELTPLMDGLYPFNDVTLLTNDDFGMHTANCHVVKEDGIWGIEFDLLSGSVGVADWYLDELRKSTNKILSKRAEYVIRQTTINAIAGYEGAKGFIRISTGQFPLGFSINRKNFDNSNFTAGERYASAFIPIEALIKGFNQRTAAEQQALVNRIDLDLLKRITMAWDNKMILTGVMRVPFYLRNATDTTKANHMWVDLNFKFNYLADYTTVDMSALNFDTNVRPTLDANMNLTGNLGKFTEESTSVKDNPLHPKVFGGCFVETGGHVRAYTIGHQQFLCYYKHQVKSVKEWIKGNLKPVITATKVRDTNMFPTNGAYGENLRMIPVSTTVDHTTYLSYMRNKKGKYQFATFNLPPDFDLRAKTLANPDNFTWLERLGEKELPVLIENTDFTGTGINISGMIFSEANDFSGCHDPAFNGAVFNRSSVVRIEELMRRRAIRESKIVNPYVIFFYYENVLYWVIADRYGVRNADGKDLCLGGVRADIYEESDGVYEIRPLENQPEKYNWGVLFASSVPEAFYGRNKETFDDIFIIKTENATNGLSVFVNYPSLPGKYFQFEMTMDGLGYYYPFGYNNAPLNLDILTGIGAKTPHQFYPSYQAPIMTPQRFYHFTQTLYGMIEHSNGNSGSYVDYYMGWKDEFPLYVVGSNITVNGRSLLVDETIKMVGFAQHEGPVFITYENDKPQVYTPIHNPGGYGTEPSNAVIFAGFWYKSKDVYAFSYHALRGISSIDYADFLNGLLPTVDGKQMASYAMGSTFPLYLGKLRSTPRQYFFKK